MKNFALSALFGIAALLLINMTGIYTGIYLAVSKLSLTLGAVLGIPGVILMVVLDRIL